MLPFDLRTGEILVDTEGIVPLADTFEFPNGLLTGGELAAAEPPRSTYVTAPGEGARGAFVYAGPTAKYGPLLSAATSFAGAQSPRWTAVGDVDGDDVLEVILATESGALEVRDADGAQLRGAFDAFPGVPSPTVQVTVGDLDGNGVHELLALDTAAVGGHVAVLDGATGVRLADFYALDVLDPGLGVTFAAQDVNGDGTDEVLVGGVVQGQPKLYATRVDVATGQATPLWSLAGPTLAGRPALGPSDYAVMRGPPVVLGGVGDVPTVIEVVSDPTTGAATVRVVDPTSVQTDPMLYLWPVSPEFAPFGSATRYTGHVTVLGSWVSVDLVARRLSAR